MQDKILKIVEFLKWEKRAETSLIEFQKQAIELELIINQN